jgi:YD repeat-containing protein
MPVTRPHAIARNPCRALAALAVIIILAGVCSPAFAQSTARYVYDDNGRLRAVIAPNGEANIYEYDAAGNFTSIRRNTATTLEVLDFSPREGAPGTTVTIIGTGFGNGVTAVSFNGTAAQIVSVNTPQVVVTVPSGATTGPLTVTTPTGSATTTRHFTVRGITVTPPTADVLSQRNVQFTATSFAPEDQDVIWSVDGIEGGSTTVGTITNAGLYLSPKLLSTQAISLFRVRASSLADSSIGGEALVMVRNPEFFLSYYSSVISIFNGSLPNLFSHPVAVVNGSLPNLFTQPVSVVNGLLPNLFAQPVSILNGPAANGSSANLLSSIVSVTKGPAVTGVSPGQLAQGTAQTLTVTGANLEGATEIKFLNVADGAVMTDLSAGGINVNPAGTTLTANITVNSGATLGRRVVVVFTPNGITATAQLSANTVEVIP